jgi:trimethylamine--corrinoid protein Co-methyltransferase
MAAIEAMHLDVAYVAVAKSLGLPTQSYMALSDAKVLDAQAGAETFGSALLAALAGVNSVSGPGMLDYVLVFSLEKLIFDNDMCGQALHFVRDFQPLEDLPTVDLVHQLLEEQHMLTAPHTLKYWPKQLYLPDPSIDRVTRENWIKMGRPSLEQRAHNEVEKRLATYTPVETDPQAEAELRRLIESGLTSDRPLPEVPHHEPKTLPAGLPDRRSRQNRRRMREPN